MGNLEVPPRLLHPVSLAICWVHVTYPGYLIPQPSQNAEQSHRTKAKFPDSNTQDEIPVSWITPMNGIDIERTIDLEKAYKECEIEINDTLKF